MEATTSLQQVKDGDDPNHQKNNIPMAKNAADTKTQSQHTQSNAYYLSFSPGHTCLPAMFNYHSYVIFCGTSKEILSIMLFTRLFRYSRPSLSRPRGRVMIPVVQVTVSVQHPVSLLGIVSPVSCPLLSSS